jgi:SNF2 family DNA or RNA helicase
MTSASTATAQKSDDTSRISMTTVTTVMTDDAPPGATSTISSATSNVKSSSSSVVTLPNANDTSKKSRKRTRSRDTDDDDEKHQESERSTKKRRRKEKDSKDDANEKGVMTTSSSSSSSSNSSSSSSSSRVDLYEYQKYGIEFMTHRETCQNPCGGFLCDEMGLGKTRQMLTVISLSIDKDPGPTLLVTPLGVQTGWLDQMRDYTPELLKYTITYTKDTPMEDLKNAKIVLVTYNRVSMESKRLKILGNIEWHRVVLDEAQKIFNAKSATFQTIRDIKKNVGWCLTGTPVLNRLDDMASACQFLKCTPQDQVSWWYDPRPGREKEIKDFNKRVMLRRLKRNVQKQLLPIKEELITVKLSKQEENLYQKMIRKARDEYEQKTMVTGKSSKTGKTMRSHVNYIGWITRLGQVSTDYHLLPKDVLKSLNVNMTVPLVASTPSSSSSSSSSTSSLSASSDSNDLTLMPTPSAANTSGMDSKIKNGQKRIQASKTKAILDKINHIISTTKDDKMLVFSIWTKYLKILHKKTSVPSREYYGTMTLKDRTEAIRDFRTNPSIRILFISLHAGGVGLNLSEANHVLFTTQWYTPGAEQQAIDRVHRIGQNKQVYLYRFESDTTVETCTKRLKRRKSNTVATCVDEGIGLDYLDIKSIFRDLFSVGDSKTTRYSYSVPPPVLVKALPPVEPAELSSYYVTSSAVTPSSSSSSSTSSSSYSSRLNDTVNGIHHNPSNDNLNSSNTSSSNINVIAPVSQYLHPTVTHQNPTTTTTTTTTPLPPSPSTQETINNKTANNPSSTSSDVDRTLLRSTQEPQITNNLINMPMTMIVKRPSYQAHGRMVSNSRAASESVRRLLAHRRITATLQESNLFQQPSTTS